MDKQCAFNIYPIPFLKGMLVQRSSEGLLNSETVTYKYNP